MTRTLFELATGCTVQFLTGNVEIVIRLNLCLGHLYHIMREESNLLTIEKLKMKVANKKGNKN